MAFNVYFEDKIITFTEHYPAQAETGTEILCCDASDMTKVLQILGNCKNLHIISSDPAAAYRMFCALFTGAEAAGGVVENDRGEILMIFRNGRWDLPKGHCEAGETLEMCALREVEEECGIAGVEQGGYLCRTQHIYMLRGGWILKNCHWWRMRYDGDGDLLPQHEEGIVDARWMGGEALSEAVGTSFASIKEVMRQWEGVSLQ